MPVNSPTKLHFIYGYYCAMERDRGRFDERRVEECKNRRRWINMNNSPGVLFAFFDLLPLPAAAVVVVFVVPWCPIVLLAVHLFFYFRIPQRRRPHCIPRYTLIEFTVSLLWRENLEQRREIVAHGWGYLYVWSAAPTHPLDASHLEQCL